MAQAHRALANNSRGVGNSVSHGLLISWRLVFWVMGERGYFSNLEHSCVRKTMISPFHKWTWNSESLLTARVTQRQRQDSKYTGLTLQSAPSPPTPATVQGAGPTCGENLGAGLLLDRKWRTLWFLILEEGLTPASAQAIAPRVLHQESTRRRIWVGKKNLHWRFSSQSNFIPDSIITIILWVKHNEKHNEKAYFILTL